MIADMPLQREQKVTIIYQKPSDNLGFMKSAMPKRPTLIEIARLAGVGIATVDRVLNGRAPVREATALRVADAAAKLGHQSNVLTMLRARAALPQRRFGFVLHKRTQPFYRAFAAALQKAVAACADIDARAEIAFSASQAPADFAAEIRALAQRCDVIASSAVDHPDLDRAVDDVGRQGIPTFCLLSDFAQKSRAGYVGLDNAQAGRIAGWMAAQRLGGGGTAATIVGGTRWHGQVLRASAFAGYLQSHAPQTHVLDPVINLETRRMTYDAVRGLIGRHPDLRALYVAGGGMEGAIAAVRHMDQPRQIALIVNELTPESADALRDGIVCLVIATPLDDLCRDLVDIMRRRVDGTSEPVPPHFLPARLYLPESV
jgi:LacI family transcriptional regulator